MKKIILFALCIFVSGAMFAQTTVTGTVIGSDDRNPIPFASVHVDGTTNLVFTGDDGKYSIRRSARLWRRHTGCLSNGIRYTVRGRERQSCNKRGTAP